jgi:hypothetical protein
VKSRLGWVLSGAVADSNSTESVFNLSEQPKWDELDSLVKQSFSLQNFGVKVTEETVHSKEDQRALTILANTLKYDGTRYEVGLLWKEDNPVLPESKKNANHRLQCAERKMDKDPLAGKAHCEKIQECIDK